MSRKNLRRTLDAVLGGGAIDFKALERLLAALGFELDRVRGSHHIFRHPVHRCTVNVQRDGKDAKPYQVRQRRDLIQAHGMTLGDE